MGLSDNLQPKPISKVVSTFMSEYLDSVRKVGARLVISTIVSSKLQKQTLTIFIEKVS